MMRTDKLLVLLGTVLGTAGLGVGAAWAAWTATGWGSAQAPAATLASPTDLTASQANPAVGTVHLAWAPPAAPGGLAVDGYRVHRTGASAGFACSTSPTTLVTSASCDDTGLAAGDYSYTVTAVWRSWSATSAPVDITVTTKSETTVAAVSATGSPSAAGQSVTYRATVSATTPGPSAPTGNVVFLDGGSPIGACGGAAGAPLSGNSATCTVTYPNVGSHSITARYLGDASHNPSPPSAAFEQVVSQAAQAITFTSTAPSNAMVGGTAYTVTATGGGSGNPVTFAIDPASTSVCSISGATVSFTGAGTCSINADQAGNADYLAAPRAQQSFSVRSPLVINGVARSGGNKKVHFTGTGSPGASVTVTICRVNSFPCAAGNLAGTSTTTVPADGNGNWTSNQSGPDNLAQSATYYAQAVQNSPAATSATFQFSTAGL